MQSQSQRRQCSKTFCLEKLPMSFVLCFLGRWNKRRTALDFAWQKLGQFTRVFLDAKQPPAPLASVPTHWDRQRDAVGTLAAPAVSSPPQRASLEHLFVLQPTIRILQPTPTPRPPSPGCNPTQASAKANIKDSQCRARPNLG